MREKLPPFYQSGGYFGPTSAKRSSVSHMLAFLKSGIVVMLISGFGTHRDIYKYIYLGNTPKIQGIEETWWGRGGKKEKSTEM